MQSHDKKEKNISPKLPSLVVNTVLFFEIGYCYVAQATLILMTRLILPPNTRIINPALIFNFCIRFIDFPT